MRSANIIVVKDGKPVKAIKLGKKRVKYKFTEDGKYAVVLEDGE